jgi:hypothetical protein
MDVVYHRGFETAWQLWLASRQSPLSAALFAAGHGGHSELRSSGKEITDREGLIARLIFFGRSTIQRFVETQHQASWA